MVKPKNRQNSLPVEYKEEKVSTPEQRLKWLTEFWKVIGMKGTPTMEDVQNNSSVELECILMQRKFLGNTDSI